MEGNETIECRMRESKGAQVSSAGKDGLRQTRDFLYRVRDSQRRVQNLEKRISIRQEMLRIADCTDHDADGLDDVDDADSSNGADSSNDANAILAVDGDTLRTEIRELHSQIENAKVAVCRARLEVSDMLSRLPDVNQQQALTYRYIDMIGDWNEIAGRMGMKKAAVQKIHGRALPVLQRLIVCGKPDSRRAH